MTDSISGGLLNAESVREADLRFTTYRLQVVEKMPPGPRKDTLLRAIHQRLVALGLPVQVHGVVSYRIERRLE
jgi:hypothetical protein